MTDILLILLLTFMQLVAGIGLVALFRLSLKPALFVALSLMLGIAVFSVVPFILQLFYIPLTTFSVFFSLALVCLLLNVKAGRSVAQLKQVLGNAKLDIKLYEVPALSVILFIILMSVWRCYYYPPTPRDLNSGAEAIAEFAVKEKTMINSLFSINLESTNNPYKPPFIICLQIIYKMAGFAFGQIWLSGLFIGFIMFLYHALSLTVHRLIAGLLIIFFLAIPEMYAYTFMVLFDYSNAVFFLLSCWFLFLYFNNRQRNYLFFAALLMGIATYIRSETLILACFVALAIMWHHRGRKDGFKWLWRPFFFILPALLVYIITIPVYLDYYLPVKYAVPINNNLADLRPLFKRFSDMNTVLIFGEDGMAYFSWFIYIFLLFFATELVVKRKFSPVARNWLYATLVIYLGMPFLGYLLPLLDLDHSTKRGLFKMFAPMLLYMGNNALLIRLSQRIEQWENKV
jgi:hypothetical protein